jgi:hypothetical protein
MRKFARTLQAGAVVAVATLPLTAFAESNVTTGGGTISATARVNFSIVIPRFIWLQVGTGTLLAANATIDTISFTPAVAVVGNGIPVAATAGSGNLGNGTVTARIIGNAGNVTLGATGPANLVSGTNTIPWTQIAIAAAGGATHPTINGANATFTAVANVVNVNGTWTYSYLNALTPASGTYTGQVLYTATTP